MAWQGPDIVWLPFSVLLLWSVFLSGGGGIYHDPCDETQRQDRDHRSCHWLGVVVTMSQLDRSDRPHQSRAFSEPHWLPLAIAPALSSIQLILPSSLSLTHTEMSTQGSKYINKEIQNAVQGVKQIKTLIEKTNAERKLLLDNLEEAKKKKEVGPSLAWAWPSPCWRGGRGHGGQMSRGVAMVS